MIWVLIFIDRFSLLHAVREIIMRKEREKNIWIWFSNFIMKRLIIYKFTIFSQIEKMTENNNTKDPVTGLTEEEVIAVEDSWSMLYRREHRKENGVKLFMK